MQRKVLVNGANGRMGKITCETIQAHPDFNLTTRSDKSDDLINLIQANNIDIVIDFTVANAAYDNTLAILEAGAHPVIGTSGLLPDDIAKLNETAQQKNLGGIIAPNFSIGAVLMSHYAKAISRYYDYAEIVEYHHERKQDSPSGTAVKLADMIHEGNADLHYHAGQESIEHARGACQHNIGIHAIRMPGLLAHHEVIFGSTGETLRLRHDSLNRECFMPGVILACQKVGGLTSLVYGLENLLDLSPQ